MRAVFINYSHPATPHVSGVRIPSFAEAMAKRGHHIVLLTSTLLGQREGNTPEEVAEMLRCHEWTRPLVVTARLANGRPMKTNSQSPFSVFLRKAVTAWMLMQHGGTYVEWTLASRPIEETLARAFRPEVVWATFLPTDALAIGQRLARSARCPWYMDLKDAWPYRLPVGMRRWMARKFNDAKGITANSRFHGEQGERWFGREVATLYDGISEEFLCSSALPEAATFRIALLGGTYDNTKLDQFVEGLRRWLEKLPEPVRKCVVFCYAGSDSAAVDRACRISDLQSLCRIEIRGYLPLKDLASLCAESTVNCYLWLSTGFHHKLLELLACGRPVLAFPGEHQEAKTLAQNLEGELFVGRSEQELIAVLDRLMERHGKDSQPVTARPKPFLTWDQQACKLEQILGGNDAGGRDRA